MHPRLPYVAPGKRDRCPRLQVLALFHSNVWGPCRILNVQEFRYFVSFIHDCSQVTWLFLPKERFDLPHVLKPFYQEIKNQFGSSIGILRFDNALEYNECSLSSFYTKNGTVHQYFAFIHPNRMGLFKGKIATNWMLPILLSFI